jgi:Chain length determinant protein
MMEMRLMRTGNKVTCIEPGAEVVPPSFAYPYNVVAEDHLAMYWRLLQKRKWVIIATIFVALTMGAISSFRAVRLYQAVGRIAIFRETPNTLGLKNSDQQPTSDDFDDTSVMLDTQVKILQSDILAREVVTLDRGRSGPPKTAILWPGIPRSRWSRIPWWTD